MMLAPALLLAAAQATATPPLPAARLAGQQISPAPPPVAQDVDALIASPENFRLILENDDVRVLEYTLLPGQRDRRHTHPQRVAHVISGGQLRVGFPDGTHRDFDEKAGDTEWSKPSPLHDTQNIGTTRIKILLVEVKERARSSTN